MVLCLVSLSRTAAQLALPSVHLALPRLLQAALAIAASQAAVHHTQTHPPIDRAGRPSSNTTLLVTSIYVQAHHPSHQQPQALAKIAQRELPIPRHTHRRSSQNQNGWEDYVDEGNNSENEEVNMFLFMYSFHAFDQIGAANKNFIAV